MNVYETMILRRRGNASDGCFSRTDIPVKAVVIGGKAAWHGDDPAGCSGYRLDFLLSPEAEPRITDLLYWREREWVLAMIRECRDTSGVLRAYRCQTA